MSSRRVSAKVGIRFAVLGIALFEPSMKFAVMLRAPLAPVRGGVVTEVKLAPPTAGAVWRRTMGGEAAKNRHVPRFQLQGHGSRPAEPFWGDRVIISVLGRQITLAVPAGENLRAAV